MKVNIVLFQPSDTGSKILSFVLRSPGTTQPDIVRGTGLSQQTVSRQVNDLIANGALRMGQRQASGRRGQPRIEIELHPEHAYSLGVALMTDAMSVLLMDFAGNVVSYDCLDMPDMSRKSVFAQLREVTARLLADHRAAVGRLCGVGVGISGYCLDGKSRYNPPQALDDWAMVQIDALFSDALGLPAWVENDGNAAAIGESFLGAGRSYANFVYVFVAAGIGGGVINDHRLWRGVNGNGGELGLMLPRNTQLPTLEALCDTIIGHGVELHGISDMLARFDVGWPGVGHWVESSRQSLSLIASSIAAILDTQAIVLGGRLPPELAELIIPVIELFDDARRQEPRQLPKIVRSQTSVDACAIGSAMIPLEKRFFSSML